MEWVKRENEKAVFILCVIDRDLCTGEFPPWLCSESIKQAVELVTIKFRKRVKHRKQSLWETVIKSKALTGRQTRGPSE